MHTPSVACIRHDYSSAFHSVQLNTSLFICPYALSNHNHHSSFGLLPSILLSITSCFRAGNPVFRVPSCFSVKISRFLAYHFLVVPCINICKCFSVFCLFGMLSCIYTGYLSSRLNPCSVCRQDVLYQLRTLAVTTNARCKN